MKEDKIVIVILSILLLVSIIFVGIVESDNIKLKQESKELKEQLGIKWQEIQCAIKGDINKCQCIKPVP